MKRKRYIHSKDFQVGKHRSNELLWFTRQFRAKVEDVEDIERAARYAAGDEWQALIVGMCTPRDTLKALQEAGYTGSKMDFMKQRRVYLEALDAIRGKREDERMKQSRGWVSTEDMLEEMEGMMDDEQDRA